MKKEMKKSMFKVMLVCVAAVGLTACANSRQDSSASDGSSVTGRLTAVSGSQITVSVMNDGGGRPDGDASKGEKPDSEASKGEKPDGDAPKGEKPDGEAPKDMAPGNSASGGAIAGEEDSDHKRSDGFSKGQRSSGGRKGKGEEKTYQITGSTKIYKQSGDEKTEVSLDEVDPGSPVTITADGENAVTITVRDGDNFRGGGKKKGNA